MCRSLVASRSTACDRGATMRPSGQVRGCRAAPYLRQLALPRGERRHGLLRRAARLAPVAPLHLRGRVRGSGSPPPALDAQQQPPGQQRGRRRRPVSSGGGGSRVARRLELPQPARVVGQLLLLRRGGRLAKVGARLELLHGAVERGGGGRERLAEQPAHAAEPLVERRAPIVERRLTRRAGRARAGRGAGVSPDYGTRRATPGACKRGAGAGGHGRAEHARTARRGKGRVWAGGEGPHREAARDGALLAPTRLHLRCLIPPAPLHLLPQGCLFAP